VSSRFAFLVSLLAVIAVPAGAAAARPFTAKDLVMLDRVSEPRVAPDGRTVVFTLRETDLDANRGVKGLWKLDLTDQNAQPQRLTAAGSNAWSARWAPDGRTLYFLSNRSGSDQVWSVGVGLGEAQQVTHLPMDVGSYRVSPDGKRLALSLAVFTDCRDLACTQQRLAARTASKESGMVYDRLFVRHWDTWSDGTRLQLFIADLAANGTVQSEPRRLTRNIDGDVPSKPDGDESEYAFAPDGRSVYFDVRIAGNSEPWSTNFDIYVVPVDASAPPRNLTADNTAWDGYPTPSADGSKLFYLAMKRPEHESDRFGIMELDLTSGQRTPAAVE
jgi:dipeptidyl aminopeptidase/acylaminoacyl peptidase